jgi:hypothetical protein
VSVVDAVPLARSKVIVFVPLMSRPKLPDVVAMLRVLGATTVVYETDEMMSVAPASIEEIDLVANAPAVYDLGSGITNVFTGNPIVFR